MKKTNLFLAFGMAALMLGGCGLGKMVKKYDDVKHKVTPNPLEVHGDKVAVTISVKYPAKYFHKKAVVNVTPKITWEGGEKALKTVKLKGEAVEGDGIKVSSAGGTITYIDTVAYQAEMKISKLVVTATATLGDKEPVDLGSKEVAEAMITTSQRVLGEEKLGLGADKYQKISIVSQTATINFAIQQANIRSREKSDADMKDLKSFVKKGYELNDIAITSYASPDGPEDLNDRVSNNREKSTYAYMSNQLKAWGLKEAREDAKYEKASKSEDWEGFTNAVSTSDMADKELILKILNSYTDLAAREKEIKNLTDAYNKMKTSILPPLRRAEVTVNSLEPKLTDEQIAEYALSNPDTLKDEELLYGATLTDDIDNKMKIYESYSTLFPEDWRGPNNVGYIQMMKGDLAAAKTSFEKASSMNADVSQPYNNMGIVAAWSKDYETAMKQYNIAGEKGGDVVYNKGSLYLRMGDYATAIEAYGNTACGYNYALTQLLSESYEDAQRIAECSEGVDEAALAYLQALIAARTGDKEAMKTNLADAISKNAAYREDAKTDMEFNKYWESAEFQEAVK